MERVVKRGAEIPKKSYNSTGWRGSWTCIRQERESLRKARTPLGAEIQICWVDRVVDLRKIGAGVPKESYKSAGWTGSWTCIR